MIRDPEKSIGDIILCFKERVKSYKNNSLRGSTNESYELMLPESPKFKKIR